MELRETKFCADFDGSLVTGLDPRDFPRHPFQEMPLVLDFLRGVKSAGDIDIATILTMRPSILRGLTAFEIRRHGLDEFFPDKSQVVHVGSDGAKVDRLATTSDTFNVALLEDSVHRVAPKVLQNFANNDELERLVTLIVPSGPKTQDRVFEFAKNAIQAYGKQSLEVFDYDAASYLINAGHRIKIGNSALNIVMLAPYSTDSGEHLGDFLNQESARVAS